MFLCMMAVLIPRTWPAKSTPKTPLSIAKSWNTGQNAKNSIVVVVLFIDIMLPFAHGTRESNRRSRKLTIRKQNPNPNGMAIWISVQSHTMRRFGNGAKQAGILCWFMVSGGTMDPLQVSYRASIISLIQM
eukprot:scpid86660/ scgid25115/ 